MKKSIGNKTLAYPLPVWIVGTYDKNGKPNAMTASWAGICCSKPPCITVSLRKATYTYENIMERKAYTISIPSENYVQEADYFGIVSGRDTDKFKYTGLTPVKSDLVDAPYVAQFPLVLECKVIKIIEIGLHTQFIGEILDVKVEESLLGQNGLPIPEKIKPIIFAPEIRTYHGLGEILGKGFSIGKNLGQEHK